MLSAARTDWFRLRRGPFIPGGSQLHRAGSFAFLAPMPLRAVKALPHPAIIANKNLFSHANLVSTSAAGICQALFLGPRTGQDRLRPEKSAAQGRQNSQKNPDFAAEKACQANGSFYNARRIRSFSPFYYEPNDCSKARFVCLANRHRFCLVCHRRRAKKALPTPCKLVE